jgi:hypothetical protein
MGQHSRKNEYIEWLLRIENGSKQDQVLYRIYTEDAEENRRWLTMGHSEGVIPPKSFSSVMLYFSRQEVGSFRTTVFVENTSSTQNTHRINATIEIIPPSSSA